MFLELVHRRKRRRPDSEGLNNEVAIFRSRGVRRTKGEGVTSVMTNEEAVIPAQVGVGDAVFSCQFIKKREPLECQIGNLSTGSMIAREEHENLSIA